MCISNKEVIPYPTYKRRGAKKGLQYWYIIIHDYCLIKSWTTHIILWVHKATNSKTINKWVVSYTIHTSLKIDFEIFQTQRTSRITCVRVDKEDVDIYTYIIHITKPSLSRESTQKLMVHLSSSLNNSRKGILLWPKRVATQRLLTPNDDQFFLACHGPCFFKVLIMTTSLSIVEEKGS